MVSIPFSTFTWISFCSSLEGPRATRSRLSCPEPRRDVLRPRRGRASARLFRYAPHRGASARVAASVWACVPWRLLAARAYAALRVAAALRAAALSTACPFVATALRAAALRAAGPRRRAACRAWRPSALWVAAPRRSRFRARAIARERVREGFRWLRRAARDA